MKKRIGMLKGCIIASLLTVVILIPYRFFAWHNFYFADSIGINQQIITDFQTFMIYHIDHIIFLISLFVGYHIKYRCVNSLAKIYSHVLYLHEKNINC